MIRIFCRRDDYAFFPPNAVGGPPCDAPTSHSSRNARDIAMQMWKQMSLPQIEIKMNPRIGLVAVPTWFWVDGYDGQTMPLTDTLLLPRDVCHTVIERDARGNAALDGQGHIRSHQECNTVWDSMTVDVVAWPARYEWDFGEGGQRIDCPGVAACAGGLGQPFVDTHTKSPIAHAYVWSSLGMGGAADAYTIQLGITFGAHFRFSVNGASSSGWQDLDQRQLTASTTQRVQEAQAVLTKP